MKHVANISMLGIIMPLVVTSPAEVDDDDILGEDDAASYHEADNTIRLNASENKTITTARANVCHETVHAMMWQSGARNYLREQLRMSVDEFAKVEEQIVLMLTPAYNTSLESVVTALTRLERGAK